MDRKLRSTIYDEIIKKCVSLPFIQELAKRYQISNEEVIHAFMVEAYERPRKEKEETRRFMKEEKE